MRRDATNEQSREARFASDEIGFKLRLRLDAQTLPSAAMKLRDGARIASREFWKG